MLDKSRKGIEKSIIMMYCILFILLALYVGVGNLMLIIIERIDTISFTPNNNPIFRILSFENIMRDEKLKQELIAIKKKGKLKDLSKSFRNTADLNDIKLNLTNTLRINNFDCISALQIGIPYNIIMIDDLIYINTIIHSTVGIPVNIVEHSAFKPEIGKDVLRYNEIIVTFYDENMKQFSNIKLNDRKIVYCIQHYTNNVIVDY
jgi:peptide deformylase